MYDDLNFALRRARTNKTDLGRFVATIVIPKGSGVEHAKSFGPRHYTIYAKGEQALKLVVGKTVRAGENDDD